MRIFLIVLIVVSAIASVAQQAGQKFEPATVTSVEDSKNPAMKESASGRQYKVGLRTATREYVVLYTPAYGSKAVEYSVGGQVSISVSKKTIRFSDIGGNTMDVPIISTRKIEPIKPE